MLKKVVLLVLIAALSVASLADLRIVTSINVIADWIKAVGHEKVEVHTLVTGLETPHTYSPKPSDTLALKRADGFVGIGLGLESWLQPLLRSAANPNLPIYYLSENLQIIEEEDAADHDHSDHSHDYNPHVWLSLTNAKEMVKNLAEYLAALDGGNADFYKQNAEKYIRELDALYTRFSEKFSQIEDKRLVSYPASYPYLFEEMGIVEVARGEETHGQEPSARRILTIADLMKKSGVKIIVSEKQFSSPLPSTLARETGGKIVYLSPLLLGGQTYLELMEANYNALLEGFAQN